ncbi:MAG: beta-galactosidase [Bacteroidota bacterium]|nr:beta-galactosidase [Bacteroidota bacterium]
MSKFFYSFITAIVFSAYGTVIVYGQTSNDHIFPAAEVAKPYIDFDSKGFLVNGARTFIVSAGLEYARIPNQLWYDRLLRIKRAGFNCVEIYTIWNFHEPQEGKFDFSGDHDLGAFLNTVEKLGMYAIVRVGPYYCAEWDNGGYPVWLKFKKGMRVREDNKLFEQYVDRFFDKLLPVVFNHQINNGGAVILIQLENEHPNGWGTMMPDDYFKHLRAKALNKGLKVPYFFSGLHHSSDPAGDGKLDDPSRPNPWFSTEFWSVWYSQYGAKPEDADLYDRRTWKIIAHGGNGYNYYMVHGGSNFGYTNNDEDAASYDYGAAIGQAGDLRPLYYTFKRAAWFARSFQDVLENSTDATQAYCKMITDTALRVSSRASPAGDIIFVDNPGSKKLKTKIRGTDILLTLAAGEIYPLVHNFQVNPETTLDWAYTRIFAIVKQGKTTTIILDAEKGTPLSLHFSVKTPASAISDGLKSGDTKVDLDQVMVAGKSPQAYMFSTGDDHVRVLAVTRAGTDKTWITDNNFIINGADYIGDISADKQTINVEAEASILTNEEEKIWLYTDQQQYLLGNTNIAASKQPANLVLRRWEQKSATTTALATSGSGNWLHTQIPVQMGADHDVTADAWYKASVNIAAAGKYTIQVKGNGRAQAFIDGKLAAAWKLDAGEVLLNFSKGIHSLAIFTAHDGRDKLAAYLGPIEYVDEKGIYGEALIKEGGPFISELTNWYFVKAGKKEDLNFGPPKFDTVADRKYKIGADAFNAREGYGWFQTMIEKSPPGTSKLTLSFRSVDENATVFINGKQVGHHDGWNDPFEINITDPEVLKKPVILSVFIENCSNEGGIDQPVRMNIIGNATAITGWSMKGGTGNIPGLTGWESIKEKNLGPCFYRASFKVPVANDQTLIWRVYPKKLGHGSIWVNGHNLGRYPEKIAAPGLYIPECWMKTGSNELFIYDEDGKPPRNVVIVAEPAAGRIKTNFKIITNR